MNVKSLAELAATPSAHQGPEDFSLALPNLPRVQPCPLDVGEEFWVAEAWAAYCLELVERQGFVANPPLLTPWSTRPSN